MARVVVIGNLGVVIDALNVMQACDDCEVALVISHPSLRGVGDFVRLWCEKHQVPHAGDGDVNSPAAVERIAALAPDYIFSIYNPSIIKRPLLQVPSSATINFHAGPLPGYRGMYTFSWAIINGEREYGVAWHEVDEGIDTGQVLFQRSFALADDETALSLSKKSFDSGIELLRDRLPDLMAGRLVPEGTRPGPSRYYGLKDTPDGGAIDFDWPFERIDRLVRGLNYYPAHNPFVLATARCAEQVFHPLRVERVPGAPAGVAPGTVLAVEPERIVVQAGNGGVAITELLNARRRKAEPGRLAQELGLKPGDRLG